MDQFVPCGSIPSLAGVNALAAIEIYPRRRLVGIEVGVFVRKREPRQAVIIAARVRVSNIWFDTQIRNVSSRGMMIDLKMPVPRGTYIEVARKEWRTAARVAWFGDGRCGLQTQDRVHLAELASETGRTTRLSDLAAAPERNRPPLWAARSFGRMLEMAGLVLAVMGFGWFLAEILYQSLSAVLGSVVSNL